MCHFEFVIRNYPILKEAVKKQLLENPEYSISEVTLSLVGVEVTLTNKDWVEDIHLQYWMFTGSLDIFKDLHPKDLGGRDFDGDGDCSSTDECVGCEMGDCAQCPTAWGVKGIDW